MWNTHLCRIWGDQTERILGLNRKDWRYHIQPMGKRQDIGPTGWLPSSRNNDNWWGKGCCQCCNGIIAGATVGFNPPSVSSRWSNNLDYLMGPPGMGRIDANKSACCLAHPCLMPKNAFSLVQCPILAAWSLLSLIQFHLSSVCCEAPASVGELHFRWVKSPKILVATRPW